MIPEFQHRYSRLPNGSEGNVNLYFNDIDIKENLLKCSQVTQLLSIRRIQTGTK